MSVSYPLRNRIARLLWLVVYKLFYRMSPRPFHRWRSSILRLFGARLGPRCHIYSAARIWAPWNLVCGEGACVADDAEVYNPARVTIGRDAVVSQGALLCTGTHDYRDANFPLAYGQITIGAGAWIAARAIVLPGVTVGERTVIGAGAVVTRSVPPDVVCAGNPAQIIKTGGRVTRTRETPRTPGTLQNQESMSARQNPIT
jgi:putative colanic acid biosynthesis acetyltransferase WcaF